MPLFKVNDLKNRSFPNFYFWSLIITYENYDSWKLIKSKSSSNLGLERYLDPQDLKFDFSPFASWKFLIFESSILIMPSTCWFQSKRFLSSSLIESIGAEAKSCDVCPREAPKKIKPSLRDLLVYFVVTILEATSQWKKLVWCKLTLDPSNTWILQLEWLCYVSVTECHEGSLYQAI